MKNQRHRRTCFGIFFFALYLFAGLRILIRVDIHYFVSWIRIQIRNKVKIQELHRQKMEPWRAVDAHNGGEEAQNVLRGGSVDHWAQIRINR